MRNRLMPWWVRTIVLGYILPKWQLLLCSMDWVTCFQMADLSLLQPATSESNCLKSGKREYLTVLMPAGKFGDHYEVTCRFLLALRIKSRSVIVTYSDCIIWFYGNLPIPLLTTDWSVYSLFTCSFQLLWGHVPSFLWVFFHAALSARKLSSTNISSS